MRMAKRLVCLPLGASPLLLSMYHKPGSTRFAVTEGLDAEADAVGPGIYGGRVERDEEKERRAQHERTPTQSM